MWTLQENKNIWSPGRDKKQKIKRTEKDISKSDGKQTHVAGCDHKATGREYVKYNASKGIVYIFLPFVSFLGYFSLYFLYFYIFYILFLRELVTSVIFTVLTSLIDSSAPSDASENGMLGKVGAWDVRTCGGLPTLYRRGRLIWSWLDRGVKLFLLRTAGGTSVRTLSWWVKNRQRRRWTD